MWGRRLQMILISYTGLILLLMTSLCLCEEQTMDKQTEELNMDEKIQGKISALQAYMKLFEQKRSMQLEAVKSIHKFSKYEQRYKLIDTMVKQIFEVLEGCKQNLTDWGFLPGDPFPEKETLKDGVSKVLESTAMFGDLILRHPDITHAIYSRHKEWEFLIGWAVWFSMESNVFQGSSQKLLHLMGQELGLLPKDENYVNPYRESAQTQNSEDALDDEATKKAKKSNKKKTKEKRKGPKLSGTHHTEL